MIRRYKRYWKTS